MAEEAFKLPGSSYEELVKIIRAYGNVGGEATPDDVSRVAAMHPTIVSRNNAFLVGIGVIEGGRKKAIAEKGRALALALEHEMPDEIMEKWRAVVTSNEFLGKLVAAVRIRKGMEHSVLQAHVAYSAGQPKTRSVMTGASAVIDILKASGLVRDEDGKLTAAPEAWQGPDALSVSVGSGMVVSDQAGVRMRTATDTASIATTSVPVHIQIQIQCSPQDIEGLGGKLRALLDVLSGKNTGPSEG